jgi:multimeric flavodoxin WrbA
MKILVLYGSSRPNGNSELLTGKMLEGLDYTAIYLREKHIEPIVDKRHTPEGFTPVGDDYESIVKQLLLHDIIIFATPLYWYGMSGVMKDFIDRWSQSLRSSEYNFKEALSQKQSYVIVTGGDNPKVKALPLIQQFSYIFGFVGMPFTGYIIGQGNAPGDVLSDETAIQQAKIINRTLARLQATK